jgi:hypothetical protein
MKIRLSDCPSLTDGAFRTRRRRDELPQCLEDLAKLLVVLTQARADVQFHLIEPLLELLEGTGNAPQLDERTHDLDVHGDRSVTAKDAGEHCHALLREDVGLIAAAAPAIV